MMTVAGCMPIQMTSMPMKTMPGTVFRMDSRGEQVPGQPGQAGQADAQTDPHHKAHGHTDQGVAGVDGGLSQDLQ